MEFFVACWSGDLEGLETILHGEENNVNARDERGMTGLMVASEEGCSTVLLPLLEAGAAIDFQDSEGRTALYTASRQGHIDCCIILIQKGANLDVQNNEGRSALHSVSVRGHTVGCRVLIDHGANVNLQANSGCTALYMASHNGHAECCSLLLEKGASCDLTDQMGYTPLHASSVKGHVDCCNVLIKNGSSVNVKARDGSTPLFKAIVAGSLDCCKLLIENGASIGVKDNKGLTSLHHACCQGQFDCCSFLLQKGACCNVQDKQGMTPLHVAAAKGDPGCCNVLIEKGSGATLDIKDKEGCSPLHMSSLHGHPECCCILLENGASINIKQNEGMTPLQIALYSGQTACIKVLCSGKAVGSSPLHIACEKCNAAECKRLLENKTPVDEMNASGRTPLLVACINGNTDCCKLLLEQGACVNFPGADGLTPITAACICGSEPCLRLLLDQGAYINCRCESWETPLFYACQCGHYSCFAALRQRGADPSLYVSSHNRSIDSPGPKSTLNFVKMLRQYEIMFSEKMSRSSADKLPSLMSKLGEPNNSFKKVPKSDTPECQYTSACRSFKDSLHLTDDYFDARYDVCFCESCHNKRGDNLYYTRGEPPKDYGMPLGWVKFGLLAPAKAAGKKAFQKWHVAFHGTRVDCVEHILGTGDLLMPGDYTPDGAQLQPPANHFDDDNPAMVPPPGHDVGKIYLSPSIRYSGLEVYAPKIKYIDPTTEVICDARCAFQIRVRPEAYDVGDQTIGARGQIDPKFPNSELEWSTKRRGVTILVGLLVKVEGIRAGPSPLDASALGPTLPQNLRM